MTDSKEQVTNLLIRLTLICITVVFGAPFIWLLRKAGPHYWANIVGLIQSNNGEVKTWLMNSLIFTGISLVISVAASVLAGFVLAVLVIPLRRTFLVITMLTMLVPITAMAMPLYVLVDHIHLHDSIWGLILASSYYPFGAFLSFLYFSSALPTDIVDIGRLDGLNDWGIFWHLGIPLSKPLWSIVTFFSFISLWNSYQLPKVLLDSPSHSTLPMGLELLFGNQSAIIGVLMVLPAIVLYLLSQRSIERGIFSGAVKG